MWCVLAVQWKSPHRDAADHRQVLHNMSAARQRGVETIINPAPAILLPKEAYQGLGHLIVNETEAAILSGLENPQNWNEVAAVFIARGVENVIITLGGEVSLQNIEPYLQEFANQGRASSTKPQNNRRPRKTGVLYRQERST
jgi:sugar/nucleoside kinase (ribokinase family)